MEFAKGLSNMFRFIVFVGVVLSLSLIALLVYWIANKVYISVKRKDSMFEIEKEAHKRIKKRIQEENEE